MTTNNNKSVHVIKSTTTNEVFYSYSDGHRNDLEQWLKVNGCNKNLANWLNKIGVKNAYIEYIVTGLTAGQAHNIKKALCEATNPQTLINKVY